MSVFSSTRHDNLPCPFIEHMDDSRPRAEEMRFPDPYYDDNERAADFMTSLLGNTASLHQQQQQQRGAPPQGTELSSTGGDRVAAGSIDPRRRDTEKLRLEEEELARLRGRHEERRLAMKQRKAERVQRQIASGQAVLDADADAAAAGAAGSAVGVAPLFADKPTAERRRRDEVRDYPHACWSRAEAGALQQRAMRRAEHLQSTRSRHLENMEMENYCGMTAARKRAGASQKRSTVRQDSRRQRDTESDSASLQMDAVVLNDEASSSESDER